MHIYFAGLGGVAIGPLALMSKDLGYEVSGSDQATSRYTDILTDRDIETSLDQTGKYLRQIHQETPVDLFVHTSAMLPDHPEIKAARELGIKTVKRHELIQRIIKQHDLKLIAVSGTHGKTTTTAMLIWLFKKLGIHIAHLVGTNLSFAPSGQYESHARYFVYEADEYDRNMLQFHPNTALIPALDYDHPDTYPTIEDYHQAFRAFVDQSARTLLWHETAELLQLGAHPGLIVLNRLREDISLAGQHNRANASLVAEAATTLGLGEENEIVDILNSFPGSERRFEKLVENLYTDYAHHPAEIAVTLELARDVATQGQKVIAVYQPHQNLRQHTISDDYQDCFKSADQLYWLPTYLSREDESLPTLQPEQLIDKLTQAPPTEIVELDDQLADKIRQHLQNGDLVVAMGAGSIDEWLRDHFVK